jgi:deoxyribodipyrimidine photolyase
MRTALVLFNRDLRAQDNPALSAEHSEAVAELRARRQGG